MNEIYNNGSWELEKLFFGENKKHKFTDDTYENFAIFKQLKFGGDPVDNKTPYIWTHWNTIDENEKSVTWGQGHYNFETYDECKKALDSYLKEYCDTDFNTLEKGENNMEKRSDEKIYSFSPFGYEGALVAVESDLRRGIPATDIVGLADGAVKESRERMQAAIRNTGFEYPSERVLISLSPADLKKEGAGFDLPVALSVLQAKDIQDGKEIKSEPVLVMGELELSGKIRPVKGVHAAASTAFASGIQYAIVPKLNYEEAQGVKGLKVYGADSLDDAYNAIHNLELFSTKEKEYNNTNPFEVTFNEELFKYSKEHEDSNGKLSSFNYDDLRAMEIAVAGKHNLLLTGAPGCGKTMLGQMMASFTPNLTENEKQSVTRIWSLAGLMRPEQDLKDDVPFRIPHQTASIEGICGGGVNCRPGEISLAHNGVLFLDEAAEFRSSVLQMLRVPLENGTICLSRAGRTTVYPAKFQLVMATNPCPCGNFGSEDKICLDSATSIEQYWKKFSAPLLDRMDIQKFVERKNPDSTDNRTISSEEMRENIKKAYEIQRERGVYNRDLSPSQIQDYCKLDEESQKFFDSSVEKNGFSMRKTSQALKVALTIANMDGRTQINLEDLKESVSLVRNVMENLEIKKDTYKHQPELPELKEKKEQKEFLENAHEAFKENVSKNTKTDKITEKEKLLNENLSENQKQEILENGVKEAEENKRVNQRTNVNTNTKIRK